MPSPNDTPSSPQKRSDKSRQLNPPQFRLKTMLLGVGMLCALLTVMVAVGMAWALGLLMLVLLIAGHVAGNALGTQLRDGALPNEPYQPDVADPVGDPPHSSPVDLSWNSPQTGRMQKKMPVGWLWIGLTVAGAIGGGILGGLLFHGLYGVRAGLAPISAAILASAILTAMAVFLTGTFIDMVHRVWREATSDAGTMKNG